MCTRNNILSPFFDMNRQRGQWEKRARDEGMNSDNDAWGKNEKCLKMTLKITLNMQNMRFSRLSQVAWKSPKQAARNLETKNLKIFLSVFRDWKVYLRKSREVSRENLYVPFATGPSTREHVAILSREKHKNPNFWKIFQVFFATGTFTNHWVVKNLYVGLRLDQPATKSPKQGNTVFEDFDNFCKNKILSKNN